jgi:hypothetical protein
MKIPRLYFDTSVFGGVYDIEFQKETIQLFEMVKSGKIICVFSDLTEYELDSAPEKVKSHFININKKLLKLLRLQKKLISSQKCIFKKK